MATAEKPPVDAGRRSSPVPRFLLQTREPDEFTEILSRLELGSRIDAISRSGFAANLWAWRYPHTSLLLIQMDEGRAVLPGDRDYDCLTVASAGSLLASEGPRSSAIEGDAAHFLASGEPVEFQPGTGSRVLAANIETSLLAAHQGKGEVENGYRGNVEGSLVLAPSAEARGLRRFFEWLFQELQRADSPVHLPHVTTEVESVLAAMLVEACSAGDELPARPGEDALRRAEEFLAVSVSKTVSLAEVAAASGVSVRTLTRGFRERHGLGPIGFLHRRRLEAARRDLLASAPGEARVTDVAHRYCFAHTGRFAIAYRRTFGESPSETLRRRRPQ
jgi:AraC-like DNA-binding protein